MSTPLTPAAPGAPEPPARVPPGSEYAFFGVARDQLQVNFCKNPACMNFGVPPAIAVKHARRAKSTATAGLDYRLHAAGDTPMLKCLLCGEHLPIKSNVGIIEELERISECFESAPRHGCPSEGCANASAPAPNPAAYQSFGKTESGSARYRCKACRKTFSIASRATLRQREIRKNVPVLKSLMNKMPLSRIADTHDIGFQTLYDKINFFHRQALKFVGEHEKLLPDVVRDTKRYVCIDRQDYAVNWTHHKDKRNVVIRAIGSADLESGFIYGMHINFDGRLDSEAIEKDAAANGDYAVRAPYRRYARLWLKPDYDRAVAASAVRFAKRGKAGATLGDDISRAYADAESRADIESPELVQSEQRFPASGMQVRNEYTMYAHFYYLQELLSTAQKLRFFMDQESSIRAACLAAFKDQIRARKADAFFVRLGKELSVDEERKIIRASREVFQDERDAHPELTDYEVQVLMMKNELKAAAAFGKWSDRWAVHPFPNQAEPEKAICCLTDFGDLDEDHKARLFLRASLHPIDRFFMAIRRRLNMLERPIGTSSKTGRIWYGYSAYQPANIDKLLVIFRAFYNYCIVGKDGKTPAMRIGLTTRPVSPAELLGQ